MTFKRKQNATHSNPNANSHSHFEATTASTFAKRRLERAGERQNRLNEEQANRENREHSPSPKSEPLTGIILHPQDDTNHLHLFRKLTEATPRDPNGFLQYFYDHSVIPPNFQDKTPNQQQQILDAAKIPLSMLEGYHSFPPAKPVWTRLPHEPKQYFEAFRAYLLSPSRALQAQTDDLDFELPGFTPFSLNEAYVLFYWHERAKAYDILKPIAAARLRDQRLLLTEDQHYILTNDILSKLKDEVEARAEESEDGRPFAGLKSSELISALSQMMQMQRVSIGLPSHGPRLKEAGYQPTPHGGMERAIRESSQNYLGVTSTGLTEAQKIQQDIEKTIAEDPNAAAALQAAALAVLMKTRQQQQQQQTQPQETQQQPPGYGPPSHTQTP